MLSIYDALVTPMHSLIVSNTFSVPRFQDTIARLFLLRHNPLMLGLYSSPIADSTELNKSMSAP